MQSQFWVLRWACRHCYDNRFRPYLRGEPDSVVKEGVRACETVIENLPADLSWTDADGTRKPTTIILAGGELLLDAVRKPLFFPVLATLQAKYSSAPPIAIQTTGDPRQLSGTGSEQYRDCIYRRLPCGIRRRNKFAFMDNIRTLMDIRGVREVGLGKARKKG